MTPNRTSQAADVPARVPTRHAQACASRPSRTWIGEWKSAVPAFQLLGAAPSIAQYIRISAPSTAIPGWTVEQGNVDWIRSFWQNQDGSSSLDLSGSRAGAVIQTVNLLAGMDYTLTFYMSGNPVSGPTTKRLTVGVGQYEEGAFVPGTFAEGQFVYDTAAQGNTLADMKWQRMTFTFTAIVPNTTIGFFSENNTAYGPALDNVSLAGVPEPGLPILFATLLLALPLGRRFLKK